MGIGMIGRGVDEGGRNLWRKKERCKVKEVKVVRVGGWSEGAGRAGMEMAPYREFNTVLTFTNLNSLCFLSSF